MGVGPVAGGRVIPRRQPQLCSQHYSVPGVWQQRSWLTCPLQDCTLRHRSGDGLWGRASPEASPPTAQRAALENRQNVQDSERTRAPAELFQSALSALDLYHPAAAIKSEVIDDPEDIAVEQGQTAASVGRAIYEVGFHCACLKLILCLSATLQCTIAAHSTTVKVHSVYHDCI